MENLKIGSKEFKFFSYTGEVLSQDKFSETHVSGSGGGGAHGRTRDIHISSTAVTKHEFWLKTDEGKEVSVQLTGHDIALREGQRVTVVYMQNTKSDSGYAALLINYTSGEYWKLIRVQDLLWLRVPMYKVAFWLAGLAVVIVSSFLIATLIALDFGHQSLSPSNVWWVLNLVISDNTYDYYWLRGGVDVAGSVGAAGAIWVLFGSLIVVPIRNTMRLNKIKKKKVDPHLEKMAKNLLNNLQLFPLRNDLTN